MKNITLREETKERMRSLIGPQDKLLCERNLGEGSRVKMLEDAVNPGGK